MSLHPMPAQSVPEFTAAVARAAFPKGNPYLSLRDEMGTIFQDDDFLEDTAVAEETTRRRLTNVRREDSRWSRWL